MFYTPGLAEHGALGSQSVGSCHPKPMSVPAVDDVVL